MTILSAHIELTGGHTFLLPGDLLGGSVRWRLDERLREAAVQLIWFVRGKGGAEDRVVATIPFDAPGSVDDRVFELGLPAGPYSFSGRLFTLSWAVRLILDGAVAAHQDIVLSPTRQPIAVTE
ncbi:MAG: hypothetical protein GC191_03330 [Azospirillum sp.]|nr:hypothetical protein [Azospirillum sp.]